MNLMEVFTCVKSPQEIVFFKFGLLFLCRFVLFWLRCLTSIRLCLSPSALSICFFFFTFSFLTRLAPPDQVMLVLCLCQRYYLVVNRELFFGWTLITSLEHSL